MALMTGVVAFFGFGLVQWAIVRLVSFFYTEVLAIESGLLRFLYLNVVLGVLTGPIFWMWDVMKPVAGWWLLLTAAWIGGCYAGHRASGLVIR